MAQWSCSSSTSDQLRMDPQPEQGPVKAVVDALRFALVGSPSFHAKQRWQFDPDVSQRRSKEFQAIHGYQSRALIERFGLGVDGKEEERRREQAIRDSGLAVAYRR